MELLSAATAAVGWTSETVATAAVTSWKKFRRETASSGMRDDAIFFCRHETARLVEKEDEEASNIR